MWWRFFSMLYIAYVYVCIYGVVSEDDIDHSSYYSGCVTRERQMKRDRGREKVTESKKSIKRKREKET